MCLYVQWVCSVEAATSRRDTACHYVRDSAGMCVPYLQQKEKGESVSAEVVNASEVEFLFNARKLLFLGTHRFPSRETVTFVCIYYFVFFMILSFLFLFNPYKTPFLELWIIRSIPLLPLLSGPLWPGVVPITFSSMGQIELFNHLQRIIIISYLKSYNCVQIIYITLEYVINTNIK